MTTTTRIWDVDSAEDRPLPYQGNEQAWQFFNTPWQANDDGDLIVPASSFWSMDTYMAFCTTHAYRDCIVREKWWFLYAGGTCPALIVRLMDSRRFYTVCFSLQNNLLKTENLIMASLWKGDADGYRRMCGYRRKVGI